MYLAPDVALQGRMKRWSKILAVAVLLIALLVFAGWQFEVPILRRPLPKLVSMNPVSAICFSFLIIAFLLLNSENPSKKTFRISIVLVSIVLIVAITKCLDLLLNLNIGVDQLLFKNALKEDLLGNTPNRMAPNTAFCFLCSSLSLLSFIFYENKHRLYFSQYFSLLVALVGWLSILGYLYREQTFYGILVYIPMAIHTATCFFLFSMSMLLVQSDRGLMKEVTSKFSGSLMARVLLPAVILVPSVLGYIRMQGYRSGVYSNEFGTAILIIVIILIFACIVWYSVALLNRRDMQKVITEKALRDSEKQVSAIFENAPDVIVIIDSDARITRWNPQAEKLFGWKESEVINKYLGDTIVPQQFQESHRKGLRRYLEQGTSNILGKSIELYALRKDKTQVDVALSISPMYIGEEQYFIGFIRDITEKKILENKLKQFNESLAKEVKGKTKELTDIFERVTDGFIAMDTDYRVIYANNKIGEFTHRDPSTLIGKVIWDEFPDAIDSPTFNAFKKAMKEQQYQINTDYNVPLDLWQENHIYPSPQGLSIFVKDISDKKRSEKAINEAKDLADKLIDSLPGVFYFFDATGKFIRWNKQFEVVTGYSAEEISTMHPTDFFEGVEKEYITQRIAGVFEKGVNDAEANFVTKDGQKIPYYFKAVLLQYQGGPCLLGNGIDITERKKAEERLALSETRFRSIIEQFPYPVVLYNIDGYYKSTNKAWEIMWRANRENIGDYNILRDEQLRAAGLMGYVERAFAGEVTVSHPYEYDPVLIDEKGQKRWMTMTLYPLKSVEGNILEIILVLQDVTDSKTAEDELRESEQKYKLLFENNPLPMFMLDLPGYNVIDVNNAALKQYGYTVEEFHNLSVVKDLRPNEDVEKFKIALNTNMRGVHHAGIWRHRRKDASILYVDIVTHDFIQNNQPIRLILANDITEKYEADEKLKESFHSIRELTEHLQKIREEERSHMAREIHDELGQLLTVLKMDVSWLNKRLGGETAEQPIKEKFKDLLGMIDTTVKTVRRLASELRPTLLDDLGLVAAIEWHLEEFEKRSGIGKEFSSSVTEIQIDDALKIGLFRIVQESLTNVARHSEAQKVNVDLVKSNGHIILKIADNGKGFDTEKMKKKTLGLLGMKERVGMMGGEYKIKSEPGQGTTVEVIVPVTNSD